MIWGPIKFKVATNFYNKFVKDTHSENVSSNKTEALTKSMNMNIWTFATLNQLLQEVLKLKLNLPKNEAVSGKNPIFMIDPFCTRHSICLKIGY